MARAKRSLGIIGIVVAAIAFTLIGILASQLWTRATTATIQVDTTTVTAQLEQASDLTTAKLTYRGLVTYEQGDIDLINKKAFTMIYDAEVRAGTDLTQAEVSVTGKNIVVSLAPSTVQQITVDPNSLVFYDEKYALFNWQDQTDTQEALKLAQDDAEAKANESSLIEQANAQATSAVQALLSPLTGDGGYTLEVSIRS